MQISRKRFEIEAWYQLPPNRKWTMADRMMTSSMTSRDVIDDVTMRHVTVKGQGRDPNIFQARYFKNGTRYSVTTGHL